MNRIGGLLATQGVRAKIRMDFRAQLPHIRQWDGQALPGALASRLEREWEKVELLSTHIKALEQARTEAVRHSSDGAVALVRRLLELRGPGEASAWLFVMELFAWRRFSNRRQIGAVMGLVPTPYKSGTIAREQGISKAGNRAVRTIAVQIAWVWVRSQRQSALTQWYLTRFAHGGPRARKVVIVAVARRLMIDLWRYLDAGVIPEGAMLKRKTAVRAGASPRAA
jgi:transposase